MLDGPGCGRVPGAIKRSSSSSMEHRDDVESPWCRVARRRQVTAPALAVNENDTARRSYDVLLDTRGMVCPMPLIKARQALMVVEKGATICVLATDPDAVADFTNFCDATSHSLVSSELKDDVYVFVIEKA
jgi:tRNA 2-thiouridine synthesizing protein A